MNKKKYISWEIVIMKKIYIMVTKIVSKFILYIYKYKIKI